jgi:hypothetical protein
MYMLPKPFSTKLLYHIYYYWEAALTKWKATSEIPICGSEHVTVRKET